MALPFSGAEVPSPSDMAAAGGDDMFQWRRQVGCRAARGADFEYQERIWEFNCCRRQVCRRALRTCLTTIAATAQANPVTPLAPVRLGSGTRQLPLYRSLRVA